MLERFWPYAGSVVAATAFALYVFFGANGSGISMVAPLAVVVFVVVAILLLRGGGPPGASNRRALQVLILLPAVLSSCVAQKRLEAEARTEADAVVKALADYSARQNGMGCPMELSEIGFDQRRLRDRWYMSYRCEQGKPSLFYSSPAMFLAAWHYDFDKRAWVSLN